MNFVITTKKDQSTTTATKVFTSSVLNTSTSASFDTTAENSFNNLESSPQAAPLASSPRGPIVIPAVLPTAAKSAAAPKSTLMIKNIENSSSNHTDWDENEEEEKEICNVLQRRDSVPTEDGTQTTTATTATLAVTTTTTITQQSNNNNKLNTIQESSSEPQQINSDSPKEEQQQQQQQQQQLFSSSFNSSDLNLEYTTTSIADAFTDHQRQEQEQELATAIQLNSFTDNLDSFSSTLGNNSSFETNTSNTTTTTTTSITSTTTTSTITSSAVPESKSSISPSDSPRRKSSTSIKTKLSKTSSFSKISNSLQNTLSGTTSGSGSGNGSGGGGSSAASFRGEEDTISKSSDTSGELVRVNTSQDLSAAFDKPKSASRLSERAKKKSWYNVLYPNYKSRAEDFKKLFKEVPNDERLIVDYSCALQRDILVQGRLYVSQNYVCFHANIFRWETYLSIKWKDVTSITKEKTALVIPNAISICTAKEKYFFATFATRDKAFLMLFRVWQNTLMNKQMLPQEMWQWVHNCYGDELGLTTDDEDYIDPKGAAAAAAATAAELELDLDFVSALEDTSSLLGLEGAGVGGASDYTTANSNSNQSINNQNSSNNNNNNPNTIFAGGNSSTSCGGIAIVPIKSKSKSYFFNSYKSSNINSSTTASASGSDNKAGSDNNSGADTTKNSKNHNTMKANAKELTLMSAKPEESGGNPVVTTASGTTGTVNESGADGDGGSGNTGAVASPPLTSSSNANKENISKNPSSHGADGGKRTKISKNTRMRDESLSKSLANMPTDISDSSDSDESKIPFVVTAECTSTHEGRQLVHTILPINIDTLFNLLFSKSKFLVDFHAMRKSTDMTFGEWNTSDEGKQARKVNVTVQLQASVGPKNSKVTEFQEMRDCSKPGELYSIDINSVNAGIPYADSFSVLLHYCLVRTIDDHTMLSVHAQIKYKKSIWGVVKGFIEKNTWAGLEDFYTALLHALQSETCIPPAKGKGRRPRRGTASQIRPLEETTNAQSKIESTENTLATHIHHTPHLPIAKHHQHAMHGGVSGSESSSGKYKWLSLFVLILLCFLIVLNVILLLKLWKLEERIEDDLISRARMPNLASLKELPTSHQDWIELLRQQEILHETELKKWHKVLQTAIELLKKTEKTLAALMFR